MTSPQAGKWQCFHCHEDFSDDGGARQHFGSSEYQQPACQINIAEYRRMEEQVRRANEEDSDTDRRMYGMQSDHQTALRREEEKGYARGLSDAKKYPEELAATPPAGIEAMREALQNHRSLYFCDEDGGLPLVDLIAHALGDKDISRALLEIGAIADAIWLENSPANAAHPAPAETENEKVMRDLLTTGTAIMFDGKRMDPCDVFEPAPADHIADGGKKVSVAAIPDGVKFDPEALNRWADAVCPFTRTQAPDNLTLSCIATLLRDLSAAPTPKEPG